PPAALDVVGHALLDRLAEAPRRHVEKEPLAPAGAHAGDVGRPRAVRLQHRERPLEIGRHADRAREVVAGAERQQAQAGAAEAGAGAEAVDHLVDGAVAARRPPPAAARPPRPPPPPPLAY